MQPDAKALAQLEKDTLQTITRIGTFARLGDIFNDAGKYLQSVWLAKGQVEAHLAFEVAAGLRADKGKPKIRRRFDVSVLIESDKSHKPLTTNASYSVVFCDGVDPQTCKVLRKFHFDYESIATRHEGEPKPTTHLQICGDFSSHHLETLGYQAEQISAWHPAFEKPRIPVQPTCLALLLNWIFLEFHTDPTINAILKDQQWNALVRKAEQQVLLPYFQEATEFLQGEANRHLSFVQSHQYEMKS